MRLETAVRDSMARVAVAGVFLSRPVRILIASLLGALAVLGVLIAQPRPAAAATGDQIDSFTINYDVAPSGVVKVQETIVYRFGSGSGRHGIERYFVTREPYDETQDALYKVENISVTSPDNVATQFSSRTDEAKGGREEQLRLRIGDPNETISAPTATYVISYDLTGAMRTFNDYDEFYWDATGLDWQAAIKSVKITAAVPGGAQDVSCFAGAAQSTETCQGSVSGGKATFSASDLTEGQGVTIGVKIKSGLVADNAPHLAPDGSKLTSSQKVLIGAAGAAGLGIAVGSPIVGALWWRKNGRDRRYAGLAPGTVPLPGQTAEVVASDPDLPIPVAFSPPRIPVAEAGLLLDGQVDSRETAATIIDLAVRGALRVESHGDDDFRVTLVDPDQATAPHEMVLLTALFDGEPPGAVRDLSSQGSLLNAHREMQASVRNQVAARGWFTKVPSSAAAHGIGFGGIVFAVIAAFTLGAWVLWIFVPLLPVIITVLVIRAKLRRGQRTAEGRAVCDQVEGFKTYLATAEADQLRFEEGEDIFSKYLPWAIAFELADRWAKVCADLVAMGRLPDVTPYWYVGNYHLAAFNTAFITSSLTSAATPAPSAGSGGTGFGGGSSFGGGGFSGGGGGGGGGGSW
ncbi:MAG TPA: DUF2207 domain-containing protein [Propionibacteriaceae bacterium]|nr:DUF2207 domain-containing protein [Propionibacteriaceae bacterium]